MDHLASEFERLLREDILAARTQAAPPRVPVKPTIHFTELWDLPPGDPLFTEWGVFRREIRRLLDEGHEGKWVLIKGEEIAGPFVDEADAEAARVARFPLQAVLMKKVLTHYPYLWVGVNKLTRWPG